MRSTTPPPPRGDPDGAAEEPDDEAILDGSVVGGANDVAEPVVADRVGTLATRLARSAVHAAMASNRHVATTARLA